MTDRIGAVTPSRIPDPFNRPPMTVGSWSEIGAPSIDARP